MNKLEIGTRKALSIVQQYIDQIVMAEKRSAMLMLLIDPPGLVWSAAHSLRRGY